MLLKLLKKGRVKCASEVERYEYFPSTTGGRGL
jgi:hypothetical protein